MAYPACDNTSERRFPMIPRKYARSIPGRTAGEFAPGQEWNGALIIKSEVGSIYIQESISSALFSRINTNFSYYRIYILFLRNEMGFYFRYSVWPFWNLKCLNIKYVANHKHVFVYTYQLFFFLYIIWTGLVDQRGWIHAVF